MDMFTLYLRLTLPMMWAPARCLGNRFTPLKQGTQLHTCLWKCIPCAPGVALPMTRAPNKRERMGPFGHQRWSVPDSLDTVSQVTPGNGCVGWLCMQRTVLTSISALTRCVLMKDLFWSWQVGFPTPLRARESVMKQLQVPPESSKNVTREKLGEGRGTGAWLRFLLYNLL